jgi:hypothetical protein
MNVFKNVLKMGNFFQAQKRFYTSMMQYNLNMYSQYYQQQPETQIIELRNKTSSVVARKKAKRKYKKKASLRWK